MKYFITPPNNIFTKEDFRELEARLGGPVCAARAAGVSYPTWYRWREGKMPLVPSRAKLIELLLRTSRRPFQYAGEEV